MQQTQKSSSKSTFIIIIVIIIVALGIYFYYSGTPDANTNSSLQAQNTPEASDAQLVGSRVLSLLNQINSLKIDTSIFNSTVYKSLVDYSIAIPEQNVGRPNPFAPIPGSAPQSSTIKAPGTVR